MSEFFTEEEIIDVKKALVDVTGAGIDIKSYSSKDEQRKTFFNKAKLWRVIERVISVLYIERLKKGGMFLHDGEGDEYTVVRR